MRTGAQRPRYWMARVVLATWILTQSIVILLEPQSLAARALERNGPQGPFFLSVLACLSAVALLDVALNDFPAARYLRSIFDRRHIGYMAMAMLQVALAGVIAHAIGFTPLLLSFWLPALFCMGIVPLDIQARHRSAA